jgi:hypothetical protein
MAKKKIEIVLDVDGKPIDVAIDATLNLKQQFRELTKELNKTKEGTKEFELLSTKLGDVRDRMETTTAKSRDLFGSLSLLPGPVGAFAGTVDSAIGSLKLFTSFSFKDLKFQLGETLNDFKDIAGNLGKATGITKIYTTLNNALAASFVKVGAGEAAAAAGARAFAAALTATGIGALIVLLGLAASALYDMATGEDEAAEATAKLNRELESQNTLLDLNQKSAKRRNAETIATLKAQGKSEAEIRKVQIDQAYKDYELAFQGEADARKIYNANLGKANAEDLKKLEENLSKKEEARKDAYSNYIVTGRNAEAAALAEQKQAQDKALQSQKAYQDKVAADRKTANEMLLDLQQENAALAIKDERKRQDQELLNQKVDEEAKINALLISQEKKNQLLAQVTMKYNAKADDLKIKRDDEDKKKEEERLEKVREFTEKLRDIEVSAIADTQLKAKAERQKGFDETKNDLDKALADKLISEEQYNTAIKNATIALNNDLKKIDDDKAKEDQDKRLKKLDDELKFLQIKGEALMQGTKAFYENQRAILNAAEQRELADTTLTEEQKTIIKEKYVQARKKLAEQEFAANAAIVSQTLDAVAKLSGAIASSYDEEAKTSKDAFEKRKKLQIATALMSAASGVIQILTQPSTLPSPFDWIVKGINAAALAVTTGVQISNIKKTQFEAPNAGGTSGASAANLGRNYADGGMINGPRHAQGGVMIEAEGGEAVMTRGAVSMFAPMLSMMNQMGGGTSFSSNAIGGARPDAPAVNQPALSQQPMIMKTYVVENELTSAQQKQARLKDLSTL